MAFPRIDHPEFAEFIRRFYGVSKPEKMSPSGQPSPDRTDMPVADSNASTTRERSARRGSSRRIGPELEG